MFIRTQQETSTEDDDNPEDDTNTHEGLQTTDGHWKGEVNEYLWRAGMDCT